jgi:hypothetical protein
VPPRTPPGVFNANYTAAFAPILPVRDYSLMSVDNETMLFVGGYVQIGTQAVSWGDPTHLALVTAFAGSGQNRYEGLRKCAFCEHPPQQVGQAKSHEKGIGERRGAKDRGGEVFPDEARDP